MTLFLVGFMSAVLVMTAAVGLFPDYFFREGKARSWDEGFNAREAKHDTPNTSNPYRKGH